MSTGRTVSVDGSEVHVLDVGSGPAVLLLHGSGPGTTGSGAWGPTAEALAGQFRLVAPDQAGFGRTPLPGGVRGGRAGWTAQAVGLMSALGVDRFAVVGHSMGGAVALSVAATHPDRVSRVVAVASMGAPGAPLSPALDAVWAARPGPDGAREMLRLLLLDPGLVTEAAVAARAEAMAAGAEAFGRLFPPPRARWVEDLTLSAEALDRLRAPVLLLHGAQDRLTPLGEAALPLLDGLPDVRLHAFGRCGHAPQVERPAEFRRVLTDFLSAGS